MATDSSLPESLQALVASFNELLPGVPATEEVLNEMLRQFHEEPTLDDLGGGLQFDLPGIGHAQVWKARHPLSAELRMYAGATIDGEDVSCWCDHRPATAAGLFELLLKLRSVYALMLEGACPSCDEGSLRLVPGGLCGRCTLVKFVTTKVAKDESR